MILLPVRNFLKIAAMVGFCVGMLHADVYTYNYVGANFDTACDNFNFNGCYPVSGMGGLTGYFSFSQPLGPNQTVDSTWPTPFNLPADPNANILLDWQIDAPSGAYWGFDTGSTLLLTTNVNGKITSWNLFGVGGYCFDIIICGAAGVQSSSTGGDLLFSYFDIYYDNLSTSTPGTWTPDFVLTPEPAATPLVKLLALLATIAAIAIVRQRRLTADLP